MAEDIYTLSNAPDIVLGGINLFDDLIVTFDATSDMLFARDSGGGVTCIAEVNPGGRILTVCTLEDTFYVAGRFSTINGIAACNIAQSRRYNAFSSHYYTQQTAPFRPVGEGGGPNGQINALFCDERERKVWAGGRFTSPGRGIAVFDLQTGVWSVPPFHGVSGTRAEVTSITTDASGASLFCGGSFATAFCYGDVWLNQSGASAAAQSPSGQARGFGFLKWARSPNALNVSIEGKAFPHTSVTPFNVLGHDLLISLGENIDLTNVVVTDIVHHPSGVIFIGGKFALSAGPASGACNVVAFKNGALSALSGGGLNGEVTSILLDGDHLYVGGAFDDTCEGTTSGRLSGIAMYNIGADTWAPLDAGIDGAVASITLIDGVLHIGADCVADAPEPHSGGGVVHDHRDIDTGYAAWHTKERRWVKSGHPKGIDIGFVVGKMSVIGDSVHAQFVGGFQYRPFAASDNLVHPGVLFLEGFPLDH